MDKTVHIPVLLKETIEGLAIRKGDVYVDGTLGGGGHASDVVRASDGEVTIVGIDRDEDALARAKDLLERTPGGGKAKVILIHDNFRNIDQILESRNIIPTKILLDLGLSSDQLDASRRGFSFKENEPLIMTLKRQLDLGDLTAKEIVNHWDESSLASVIWSYGEERYARKIARAIVSARKKAPVRSTHELVEIVKKATPFWYHHGKIHPATRTFQALRIAVNDELGALKDGLEKAFARLSPGGRMAVISFHSLEDRIVKHFFKHKEKEGKAKLINKRPIEASQVELEANRRSRSAKLRVIEKL